MEYYITELMEKKTEITPRQTSMRKWTMPETWDQTMEPDGKQIVLLYESHLYELTNMMYVQNLNCTVATQRALSFILKKLRL